MPKFVAGLLAGAALLASAAVADAKVIELRVRSGGTANFTTLSYATPGASISQSGLINDVTYSVTGSTNEAPNAVTLSLTTASTNTVATTKTVEYWLTVTGLTGQPNITGWQDLFSGINANSPPPPDTSVLNRIWYSTAGGGNVKYSTQNLIYDSGFPGGCGSSAVINCTPSGSINLSTPYSLTMLLSTNYRSQSAGIPVNSSSVFTAVPEPTSLALLGSGLLLAGWMFRRRQSNKVS